jgi:hypothetical protein
MADAGRPNIFCAAADWGNKVQTINPQMVLSGTSDEVMIVKITMGYGLNHCPNPRFVDVYRSLSNENNPLNPLYFA